MTDHLCPGACIGVMRLINHQQLEKITRQFMQPARQCLHACYLHRMAQVHAAIGGDQPMPHTHAPEAIAGLFQQLSAMDQDADAVATLSGRLRDVAEANGLASTGRQHR